MKKTIASILLLLAMTALPAQHISGYVGVSTGYEWNMMNSRITKLDSTTSHDINFQGVPFHLEGETYLCPWVGIYYGVGIMTIPTVLKDNEDSYIPFDENAPTLYTSPYIGLALRYDFTHMIAMVLNTGLSYTAWKIPGEAKDNHSNYLHMLNARCDLALGVHPRHNIAVRMGLKVDTPVYTGSQYSSEESGIRLEGTGAEVRGVKLVPYIGLGYAYGRSANK